MIPFPIVPLTGLGVLVTRPHEQAIALGSRIESLGGTALVCPAIAIEGLSPLQAVTDEFDWIIFISTNSVVHGLPFVKVGGRTRVAAIGKTTAAALESRNVRPDAIPENGVTSEALLEHPAFVTVSGQKVLIVKGAGGRELLHDALVARGAQVSKLEVYRRIRAQADPATVAEIARRWREEDIDVVTLTSVDILENLISILAMSADGEKLLRATPFVAASERIAESARERGLTGDCVLASGADDDSIVGAIAAWHARAR